MHGKLPANTITAGYVWRRMENKKEKGGFGNYREFELVMKLNNEIKCDPLLCL